MKASNLAATFIVAVSLSLGFVAGVATYHYASDPAEASVQAEAEAYQDGIEEGLARAREISVEESAEPSHVTLPGDLECWTDCWYADGETGWTSMDVLADDYRRLLVDQETLAGGLYQLSLAIGGDCTVYEDLSWTCEDGTRGDAVPAEYERVVWP